VLTYEDINYSKWFEFFHTGKINGSVFHPYSHKSAPLTFRNVSLCSLIRAPIHWFETNDSQKIRSFTKQSSPPLTVTLIRFGQSHLGWSYLTALGLVIVWKTKIVILLLTSFYVLESFSFIHLNLNPTLITGWMVKLFWKSLKLVKNQKALKLISLFDTFTLI